MWDHVEMQLLTFPGGVGNNLEDWVEQRHQTGKRQTELSKYIKDDGKKYVSMARREHVSSNPEVRQRQQEVKERSTRKRNFSTRVSKKAAAKLERDANRQRSLEEAEAEQEATAVASSLLDLAAFAQPVKKESSGDGEIGNL